MPPISAPSEGLESPAQETAEHEQCVPVASLAMDGTTPAEGDEVSYSLRGTVTRIEGDKAYIKPTAINDEPLPAMKTESPEDEMMEAAQAADDKSYTA